mgnify:CR=1 FL=1
MQLLAFGEAELDFADAAVVEVHRQWNDGHALFGHRTFQLFNFAAAQQHMEKSLAILESQLPVEAASYEATGQDYVALLEAQGETAKAEAFKKKMYKALG